MKSMTGYGRAELKLPDHTGVVELSSVNKKGFEFLLHGPKEWQFFEKKAQEIIRSSAERGRIRLSILLHANNSSGSDSPEEPFQTVHLQLKLLKKLCEQEGVSYTPTTELIQRVISTLPRDVILPCLESVEDSLIQSTRHALNEMISMRQHEGSSLAVDLRNRSKILKNHIGKIEQQAEGISLEWRDRMIQRILDSGLEIDCENEALRREFAVYAEKSDISEEITRILSHLEQFDNALNYEQPIGRKLEFIVQELGREFNTLGSKSSHANISSLVIDAKVEIEKIREQVMNIE